MARQLTGFIEGTYDDLTFYKMEEKYYVRMKSSLTGKRFRKDPRFEGSRKSSSRFGLGNMLASRIYRVLDKDNQTYPLFCFLKCRAITMLKQGRPEDQVMGILREYLRDFGFIPLTEKGQPKSSKKLRFTGQTHNSFQNTTPGIKRGNPKIKTHF